MGQCLSTLPPSRDEFIVLGITWSSSYLNLAIEDDEANSFQGIAESFTGASGLDRRGVDL